ncbi:MAG: hypothetical protein JW880_08020 [Candidatus Thermoplasmatota archaeon]|nr:hypothetical protein [Candidatus Thermoplasmatota archaeon]
MVKAIILVMLQQQTVEESDKIRKIQGIVDGYPVFGHYDYVAFVDMPGLEKVGQIADKIQKLGFVRYVETLIER